MNEKHKGKDSAESRLVFTKETLGVVMVLFATLCLVFLITGDAIMYPVGGIVRGFLFGCFGYFAYAVMIYAVIKGVCLVVDKVIGLSNKLKFLLTCSFVTLVLLCQVISMRKYIDLSYGNYLSQTYMLAQGEGASASVGGIVVSLVSYWFSFLLTNVGSYVILGILLATLGYFTVNTFVKEWLQKGQNNSVKFRSSVTKPNSLDNLDVEVKGVKEYPVKLAQGEMKQSQKLFLAEVDSSAFKAKRKNVEDVQIKIDYTSGGLGVGSKNDSYSKTYQNELESKLAYIKTPAKIDLNREYISSVDKMNQQKVNETNVSDYISPLDNKGANSSNQTIPQPSIQDNNIPLYEHTESVDSAESRAREFSRDYLEESFIQETTATENVSTSFIDDSLNANDTEKVSEQKDEYLSQTEEIIDSSRQNRVNIFESEFKQEESDVQAEDIDDSFAPSPSNIIKDRRARGILFNEVEEQDTFYQTKDAQENDLDTSLDESTSRKGLGKINRSENTFIQDETPSSSKPTPPINREYFRPSLDLLQNYVKLVDAPQENHAERMEIIKQTLEDFHIPSEPQSFIQGPSVTRYEIRIPTGKGISVKKVLNYDDDLKMRLACKDGVRIEAPIPGKDLVGIEVANKVKVTVGLREVMELSAQKDSSNPNALMFAIGKDIVGNAITDNLAKGPHYLVAGATGSGKSVCLNTMIVSLIMRYSPEDLRLILIDPKSVEFSVYEHLPHLMIDEIITNSKRAIAALSWAYEEMERRFKTFKECGQFVVDIDSYNNVVASDTMPKIPRIVIIIDELADLMQTCKKDLESRICAIAQKARSAGIHLVLATQRPSVDVITGTIKANLPSRIAFKVTNFQDSQTILAEAGAEKLLGNGDMLYKNSVMPDMGRYQGAFITAKEVNNVCSYIREHNEGFFNDELMEYLDKATKPVQEESVMDEGVDASNAEVSPIFLRALWLAVNVGKISISALQRRFQIGYSRAGGIVDKMERMGYVSGDEGSKARRVILTREEFEEKYGEPPAEEF